MYITAETLRLSLDGLKLKLTYDIMDFCVDYKVNESLVFLYFNLYCFSSLLFFFQEINEGRCLSCSFVIGVKMSHFDKLKSLTPAPIVQ